MVDTLICMYVYIGGTMKLFNWKIERQKPEIEPKKPDTFKENWKKDMLLRWTDLEARNTALELVDKKYKKQVRHRIEADADDEKSDLYKGAFIPQ